MYELCFSGVALSWVKCFGKVGGVAMVEKGGRGMAVFIW